MIIRRVQIENEEIGELTWVDIRIPYHCALSKMEDNMTKHYCDICGQQLDGKTSYRLTYQYLQHTDNLSEYHSGKKDIDLCENCFNAFEKTWDSEKEMIKNDSEGNT